MKYTAIWIRAHIVSIVVLLVFLAASNSSYQQSCVGPALASDQGWKKCSIVFYWIEAGFSTIQRDQITAAFGEWNSANQTNNSKVKFRAAVSSALAQFRMIPNTTSTSGVPPAQTDRSGSNNMLLAQQPLFTSTQGSTSSMVLAMIRYSKRLHCMKLDIPRVLIIGMPRVRTPVLFPDLSVL